MNIYKSVPVGIVAVVLAFSQTGCSEKVTFKEPVRPIKYVDIVKGASIQKKVYNGVSRNITESEISFRVGGKIIDLPVKVGEAVKEGQVLARLDPTDYQTRVSEMRAKYISADADIKRYRLLYEEESATKQELDQAQANYDISRAQYDYAKQELSYSVLQAPKDGLIVSVAAEIHENVSSGQTICVLESGKEIEVKVGLPESLIGKVSNGDKVTVSFDSSKDRTYEAVVTEVGVRIDEKTATFPVTVEIVGNHRKLRAGMVADIEFTFRFSGKGNDVIMVPSHAVLEDSDGNRYVWVFNQGTQTVNKRKVKIGDISQEGIVIKSGLKGGEIVASAGAHYLREGQKVKLVR